MKKTIEKVVGYWASKCRISVRTGHTINEDGELWVTMTPIIYKWHPAYWVAKAVAALYRLLYF